MTHTYTSPRLAISSHCGKAGCGTYVCTAARKALKGALLPALPRIRPLSCLLWPYLCGKQHFFSQTFFNQAQCVSLINFIVLLKYYATRILSNIVTLSTYYLQIRYAAMPKFEFCELQFRLKKDRNLNF